MKALIYYFLFFALSLQGCKVKQNSTQTDKYKSTVNVKYTKQEVQSYYFSGKVIDSRTNEALIDATVTIENIETKELWGALTDVDGNFLIKNLKVGTYRLKVDYSPHDLIDTFIEIKEYSNCVAEIRLYEIPMRLEKPIIYLYPNVKQALTVKLNYKGTLTHTYPKYPVNGWQVTAEPDGTLRDEKGQEYYALFWEGLPNDQIIPQDGFVIRGEETAAFLEEKLAYLGLNRREANEFIMYWLPQMEDNPYNFIQFSGKQYLEQAELYITPKPETAIRVMMLTQPLDIKISFPLQDLSPLKMTRKGFTVVEWGGSVINNLNL